MLTKMTLYVYISWYEPVFRSSQRKRFSVYFLWNLSRILYFLNFKILKFLKFSLLYLNMFHQKPTPFSLNKKKLLWMFGNFRDAPHPQHPCTARHCSSRFYANCERNLRWQTCIQAGTLLRWFSLITLLEARTTKI